MKLTAALKTKEDQNTQWVKNEHLDTKPNYREYENIKTEFTYKMLRINNVG